ncbi:hypothetical protein QCA50_012516 [Cerrena zonata]|uniref:Uncharacterized protein n=1 Tax=Cerrena zonata TaxID=2478898 RepID=A0AAW0FYQ6_9APHY
MPLFGHKDKHATDHNTATATATDPSHPLTGVRGIDHNAGPGFGGNTTGIGSANAGYNTQPGLNNRQGYAGTTGNHDPYGTTVAHNDPSVPPAQHINSGSGHHSGTGSSITGKVEHAVGSMVGSQALKMKGIQKEQEAQAFKQQSAELVEAEKLEREALLRRERAVQHGAHPRNKALGGGFQGQEFGNNFDNAPGTGPTGPQGYGGGQVL